MGPIDALVSEGQRARSAGAGFIGPLVRLAPLTERLRLGRPGATIPSLRRRIQAGALLAVLAGYGVLLIAQQELSSRARFQRHLAATALLTQELLSRQPAMAGADSIQTSLEHILIPGSLIWLESQPGRPDRLPNPRALPPLSVPLSRLMERALSIDPGASDPRFLSLGGRDYLFSSQTLELGGPMVRLRVLEDVTEDVAFLRITQLLLVAAAGLTSLLTALLLRLVLRQGLQPLDQLGDQLVAIDVEQLAEGRVSSQGQPEELLPIVRAFNDLLQRLALERERQQAFVDGVAHELRTPITLISGYAQSLLRRGSAASWTRPHDPAAEQEIVGRIAAEARRMGRLVADLLLIARDDVGRLELSAASLDLEECLLEAFERLEGLALGRLVLAPPGEGPSARARGDAEHLQQCLTNLVENALKYTPAGSRIELFSSACDGWLVAHVRDQGEGVPSSERQRIFERFERASSTASGSGIGLSVVQLLMRRMGGEARVRDAPGGGADFQLLLPRLEEEAALRTPVHPLSA